MNCNPGSLYQDSIRYKAIWVFICGRIRTVSFSVLLPMHCPNGYPVNNYVRNYGHCFVFILKVISFLIKVHFKINHFNIKETKLDLHAFSTDYALFYSMYDFSITDYLWQGSTGLKLLPNRIIVRSRLKRGPFKTYIAKLMQRFDCASVDTTV